MNFWVTLGFFPPQKNTYHPLELAGFAHMQLKEYIVQSPKAFFSGLITRWLPTSAKICNQLFYKFVKWFCLFFLLLFCEENLQSDVYHKLQARNAEVCVMVGMNNISIIKNRQLRATHTKFYLLSYILI